MNKHVIINASSGYKIHYYLLNVILDLEPIIGCFLTRLKAQ